MGVSRLQPRADALHVAPRTPREIGCTRTAVLGAVRCAGERVGHERGREGGLKTHHQPEQPHHMWRAWGVFGVAAFGQ